MIRKLLFQTRLGEWLLTILEQKVGLAIVEADWLADRPATALVATSEAAQ